ncbi:MAG TPA: septum formation initiator family protein [Pyrinomonadaceae bacterium]|nr:septum formation initiator family protein [Pyrinomonadaceae bacterium]
MSRVVNSYWVDERIRSQRVASRAVSPFAPVREISVELIGSRADIRRRGGIIPSWVLFGMIMLATLAVCATVTVRTRTRMNAASEQYVRMRTDVQALRDSNKVLKVEVEQLRSNPRAIESAARTRLNMVRDNEILVPIE